MHRGFRGVNVDWSHLDGAEVWMKLLPSGDIAVVIDGGYGDGTSDEAKAMTESWAEDLGLPIEPQ